MRTIVLLALFMGSHAHAITVSISVQSHSYCGQNNASLNAYVSGGTPPYTYTWSNGVTESYNFGLGPGIYTLTVTDALLDEASDQAEVFTLATIENASAFEEGGFCLPDLPYVLFYAGTENGLPPNPAETGTSHTPGPYTFDAGGYAVSSSELPDACSWFAYYKVSIDAPAGTYVTVNFTDGAGCPGSFGTTIKAPIDFPTMQVVDVTGSCSNGAIGSATVAVAPTTQELVMHLRNAAGSYIPNDCSSNWVGTGNGLITMSNLAPGTYWAVLDNDLFNQFNDGTFCTDSVEIVIPDLGTTCGRLSGRIYVDGNANCILNGGENMVPSTVIEITPGPLYVATNTNGQYSIDLPFGTYTLAEQHPVLEQSCPQEVTLNSAQLSNINIGCSAGDPLDVQLMMSNGPARPGFELHYGITVDNLTTSATGVVILTMEFDPALGFLSATPSPSSVVGNTITWTAPSFTMTSAFQHKTVGVRFQIPPDVGLLGTTLTTTASIVTTNSDVDLSNNSSLSAQEVTGSFDPNDKTAVTSSQGAEGLYLIDSDEWIDYTIRFQNTGTDTAFNVVITDTLPHSLDPASIQWGPSSHTCTRQVSGTGYVKFIFPSILLPDSNVNEALSHGFVSFRIKPLQPVLPGTTIENIANIYFDFNQPVITEPSVLVASTGTGVGERDDSMAMQAFPNPTDGMLWVQLHGDRHGVGQLRIVAMDGRVLMEQRTEGTLALLDLSHLSAGPLLIEWISLHGERHVLPMIRQ